MDPYLFKRLWRRPWLSLCSLILSCVLCLLMGLLSGYRQELENRLAETKMEYDILCIATNRHGVASTGLKMGEEILNFVFDESEEGLMQFAREVRVTKEFRYSCFQAGLVAQGDQLLIGVNDERCDPKLDPELGGCVNYMTGDFYTSDTYQCIVSEELLEQLGANHILLDVVDPFISSNLLKYVGSGSVNLTIVGTYEGSGNRIFISFETARRLAREISKRESFDSLCFFTADNENYDEIYSIAKRYFSKVDPNAGSKLAHKSALTIHDGQYRATVTALEQNIARTGNLLPIVLLLGLGVGFLISFLFTRSERKTYALMRTLGMTR